MHNGCGLGRSHAHAQWVDSLVCLSLSQDDQEAKHEKEAETGKSTHPPTEKRAYLRQGQPDSQAGIRGIPPLITPNSHLLMV